MLKLENCSKKYGNKEVFSDVSYIFENEIYWLLGKNGVGKSVFCRCVVGLEPFSNGNLHGEIGNVLFLPDTSLGEKWLTVNESIDLMLFYFGIFISAEEKQRIKEVLEIEDGDKLISQVSVGTGMKVGLFLVFIRNFWQTIILDETLSHVDIHMKAIILNELEMRKKEGAVILIINHGEILSEHNSPCIKKIYLKDGRIFNEES